MAEKIFNSRIIHKHDVESNWIKATGFIPQKGEIIVYDVDATYNYERFKIGDGATVVSSLPFANDALVDLIDAKVDKVSGKGLSTNDYTTADKNKLSGIATGANKTVIDSALSATSTNPVQNKIVTERINNLDTLVGDTAVATQISNAVAGKANSSHTHNYAGSTSAGGVANSAKALELGGQTITSLDDDTTSNWAAKKTGFHQYWSDDRLVGQPGTYGHLLNIASGSGAEVKNLWFSDHLWYRYGNTNGWKGISQAIDAWIELLDSKNYTSYIGPITATSSDGAAYAATVSGITSLTSGVSFIMLPGVVSTTTTPTLNVNSLGAKPIRRRLSAISTSAQAGYAANWLAANKPFRVTYDGTQWIVEGLTKPSASDLYGTLAISKGGTGATTAEQARINLGVSAPKVVDVALLTASWSGSASPWSQVVTISGVTANSKVDLQPNITQLVELQNTGIALMAANDNGTVTVYAIGGKPSTDMTMQATITEVTN